MATSEAQKKASIKYMNEKLEEIRFRVPKEQKKEIQDWADKQGKSVRAYILGLIESDMGTKK